MVECVKIYKVKMVKDQRLTAKHQGAICLKVKVKLEEMTEKSYIFYSSLIKNYKWIKI